MDVMDSFSEVEVPESNDDDFFKVIESSGEEVDIFLENCSSLYNLILDSLHNLTSKAISCECLDEMTTSLEKSAKKILAERPEAENSVLLRLNTICCAMEQLRVQNHAKLMSGADSDTSSSARSSTSSSTGEMRSWLHEVERRLEINEKRIRVEPNLTVLLSDQQALQLEIQHEGQLLVNRLNRQLKDDHDTDSIEEERRKTCVDAIRKRWHTIYLNSLSLVCRIEELINHQQASEDSESDPDLVGPPIKRARTRTGDLTASDTEESEDEERHSHTETVVTDDDNVLPFAESEYESIMDGRVTVDSCTSSSEDQMVEPKKWESVQQDVGYSSGENSIHEALNTCADHLLPETSDMRRKRIECSPVKAFYRTVQLEDMSDLEVTKAINHDIDEEPNLSDSMYVNHDSTFFTNQNLPEYDEVMALMDNDDLPMDMSMTESFNTKWREIHGQKKPLRRMSRPSREQMDLIAKSSCDASSEDSSDGENQTNLEDESDMMSVSFNSASFETSSPLKRQRSTRGLKNASFLYDSLEMDGSFCSTRSEMLPPCKARSLARRKLRVRRMPRSMSDGEQLGVVPSKVEGVMTPMIRVSPPSTPVRRLLRKLDDQIRNRDSDTAPEHSDAAQAYEWDEYNPPQKDDSTSDRHTPTMTDISNQLMNIDDDFAEHFGTSSAYRLIEESKSHLRVVQKALEESNSDIPHLSNFELIARSNLRQVDQALKIQTGYQPFLETSTLQELRNDWSTLYESIRSPFVRIMHQVKKFAATLQEVSSMASLGDVDIRSKEDVMKALDAVTAIERRLSCERQELRDLLASSTFRDVAKDLSCEFETVSEGYDDAVDRIGKMAHSLSQVKGEWDAWNSRQNDIRSAMVRIESHLKEGQMDNKMIAEEMELCQERMNSLETMCNYLTASLGSIQNETSTQNLPDFKAELSIYSNALARLRDRFNDMVRVPSPPVQFHPPEPRPSKSIGRSMTTQTAETETESDEQPLTVSEAISSSRLIKFTFALSLLSALAAIFYYHVFGKPFGPHVTYVNGPPPV
ncbi:LOW QUALITY PROTEIN: Protein CBG18943 [Caenorhabditis briggsae]|uniref:Protein CBG18943 n=1 Tax=Caenorhabditis briggsae TaxID=6238 RepID=A8XUE6_CAEBR|nr:LOW QUALITY PROTEIN: Protein CBG18943 [Caenorhabditis briggsae]CAP36271.1 Protein CBG18943 [Caenorhabditis briggsae]